MEQFVNNAQTSLPAALLATATMITFTSLPAGFPAQPQFRILISDASNGDELLLVTAVGGAAWTVARGIEGTTAVAHASGCTVTATLTAGALGTLRVGEMFNVRDYGAVGDGSTDDTGKIQAACNDAAINGGTVFLPNGTYKVCEIGDAICVYVQSNTTLLGESRDGAIIKLANGQNPSVRPITLQTSLGGGVTDVAIRNLTIDGNKAGQSDDDEHRAGIFMAAFSARLYFADLVIHDNTGDALDVYEGAQYVVIERCYCYSNDRRGIAVNQGLQQHLWIRDCQFVGNNGQISVELSADPGPVATDITVTGCFCDASSPSGGTVLSFTGVSGYPTGDVKVSNCVINGVVYVAYVSNVVVEHCAIATSSSDTLAPVIVDLTSTGVVVRNNTITIAPQTSTNAHACIAIADSSTDVVISGNTCVSTWDEAHGVELLFASSVQIIGNAFYAYDGTNTSSGVYIWADGPFLDACIIANNYFRDPGTAVAMLTESKVNLVIAGNIVEKINNSSLVGAFALDNTYPTIHDQISVFDNELVGFADAFASYPNTAMLIAGVRGSGGTYSCSGSPNSQITEIVGAIAFRRDGGAGSTLYVKESGTGNTGWVAK